MTRRADSLRTSSNLLLRFAQLVTDDKIYVGEEYNQPESQRMRREFGLLIAAQISEHGDHMLDWDPVALRAVLHQLVLCLDMFAGLTLFYSALLALTAEQPGSLRQHRLMFETLSDNTKDEELAAILRSWNSPTTTTH